MITVLVTAVAGGLGATARFVLDVILSRRVAATWVRLLVINASGSAALGLVAGLAADRVLGADLQLVLGGGFLGGYTTFSAASLATVRLVEDRRWVVSVASSLGMLLGSVAAATLGLVIGLAL